MVSSDSGEDDDIVKPGPNLNDYFVEVHTKIQQSGIHNFKGEKVSLDFKGLNCDRFREKLEGYDDVDLCNFIQFGWPIGHCGRATNCNAKRNHTGAREFPEQVQNYIDAQVALGRIVGPFDSNPYSIPIAVSPLNSLPKKGTSDRRVITDLSFPDNQSVNSGIDKDSYLGIEIRTKYPTVDHVIALILKKGKGCKLFKRDMRKAFRQIRVDPGDIHLLSFKWKGKIYSDTVLTMGLRSAAYICQRLTNGVAHICKTDGFEIVNYLDDFCGVEGPETADRAFSYLGNLLQYLGIEEAFNKVAEPSTRVAFLGIWFDTIKLSMEVTPERLTEIKALTALWLNREVATVKDVQSIIGKLNFVAKCVRPARIFISRMLNFLREMPKKGKSRISVEFLNDIAWWHRYLPQFNGISLISLDNWSSPDEIIASDACLVGCGATCGREFFHKVFPEAIVAEMLHINALELLALVVAISIWGSRLTGKKLTVLCDNSATVWVINTGKTRDRVMQVLLRELCFICATNGLEIFAKHIPGVQNRVPDLLSRWSLSGEFRTDFIEKELCNFNNSVRVDDSLFDVKNLDSHWL
jgi:hypothetical protein